MTHDSLFPDHDFLMAADSALTERLGAARRLVPSRDVVPYGPSGEWLRELRNMEFDRPRELADLTEWVIGGLETGTVQVTHPGYLGLFNPAPTFASECADRIASVFNPQVCVHSHAPAAVEIELRRARHSTGGQTRAAVAARRLVARERLPHGGRMSRAARRP